MARGRGTYGTGSSVPLALALAIIGIFIYFNVSPEIGTAFGAMTIIYLISVVSTRVPEINFFPDKSRSNFMGVLIAGALLFVGFVAINTVLFSFYSGEIQVSGIFASLSTLSTVSNVPVLSAEPITGFVIRGILIPIVESAFFLSVVLSFFAKYIVKTEIRWDMTNFKMHWVAALVGASASIFHLTQRVANPDIGLLADFVFFYLSALIVFRMKSLASPSIAHILVNSIISLR